MKYVNAREISFQMALDTYVSWLQHKGLISMSEDKLKTIFANPQKAREWYPSIPLSEWHSLLSTFASHAVVSNWSIEDNNKLLSWLKAYIIEKRS